MALWPGGRIGPQYLSNTCRSKRLKRAGREANKLIPKKLPSNGRKISPRNRTNFTKYKSVESGRPKK